MNQPTDIELPLYQSFIQLMQLEKDLPRKSIDPASYLLLIETLRNGYMLNTREELIFFCKKLWLKPYHRNNPDLNESVLEQILYNNLEVYAASFTPQAGSGTSPVEKGTATDIRQSPTSAPNIPPPVETQEQQAEQSTVSSPIPISSSLMLNIEEIEADNKFEHSDYSQLFKDQKFEFNYQYLPVSRRFIEQTIRSLRYKLKGAGRPLVDIESTVKDMVTRGHFDGWRMQEQDDFVTRWTLMLDRDGSMLAFHSLEDALADAAIHGTMKNEGDVFYFRNVPTDYLYTNPQRNRSIPFEDMAQGPRRNILIVSDAGAARGSYSRSRIASTLSMLYKLRQHRLAWLNPLPKERWKDSSAAVIANTVNMFQPGDDNSDELGNIVRFFKSKLINRNINGGLWQSR